MGKFASMVDLHRTISESDNYGGVNPHNWRKSIEGPLESGDLNGLKEAALPSLQLQMLQLAHTAKSDSIKYQATAFLLAQSGHGPMNRVEHTVDYKRMPADQLQSIVQAKLQALQKLNPGFDVKALIPAVMMNGDSEFVEHVEQEDEQYNVPRETQNFVQEFVDGEFEEDEGGGGWDHGDE